MKTFKEFLEEAYKLPGEQLKFKTYYHGTTSNRAQSARNSGFRSATGNINDPTHRNPATHAMAQGPNRIYASPNKNIADKYAQIKTNQKIRQQNPISQLWDRIRGRNSPKPETLQLAVSNKADIRTSKVVGSGPKDKYVTIPTNTANVGLRNAQALERRRRGTVRNPSGTRRLGGGSSSLQGVGRGVEQSPSGLRFTPGTGGNYGISGIGLAN